MSNEVYNGHPQTDSEINEQKVKGKQGGGRWRTGGWAIRKWVLGGKRRDRGVGPNNPACRRGTRAENWGGTGHALPR